MTRGPGGRRDRLVTTRYSVCLAFSKSKKLSMCRKYFLVECSVLCRSVRLLAGLNKYFVIDADSYPVPSDTYLVLFGTIKPKIYTGGIEQDLIILSTQTHEIIIINNCTVKRNPVILVIVWPSTGISLSSSRALSLSLEASRKYG